jgi:hypothetical protein
MLNLKEKAMNIRNMLCQILLWLFIPLLLSANTVQAQEKEMLAEMWVMQPKAGMEKAFAKALADHVAHRQTLGDPRSWQVYTPVLGDNLNEYVIRSCCFEWKDLDAYEKWTMEKDPLKHWNNNADDKVANYGHYFAVMDMENSHWPDGVKANFVGVTHFSFKPGHWQDIKKDMKTISDVAKQHKWPYHWSWSYPVSGKPGMHLVIPHENFASMAPPEVKFNSLMVKHLGSEDKAAAFWKNWSSHFSSTHYEIYRHNKELSMPEKKMPDKKK